MQRNIILIAIITVLSFLFHSKVLALTIIGKVYSLDSKDQKILFTFKNLIKEIDNQQLAQAEYRDPLGNLVAQEVTRRKGSHLIQYEMNHLQTGRKGKVAVSEKKISFSYEDTDGRKSDKVEEDSDNFIINFTLVPYVFENWSRLNSENSLRVRFGVWDRQETIEFIISKVGEEEYRGQRAIKLQFKPASFFISKFVDPVSLFFTLDGKRVLGSKGRVVPRTQAGGKWKDLDAEVVYEYIEDK